MAAQLTLIRGPEARKLRRWIRSATSSLPVPLSPVMRTVASRGAIRSTISLTCWMAWLLPTSLSVAIPMSLFLNLRTSARRDRLSRVRLTMISTSFRLKGLAKYSYAPLRMASRAVWRVS